MPQPDIEVLGVYHLSVTEALLQEQFDILYGYEMSETQRRQAKQQCREQLEAVALIEVLVSNADSRFSCADFTQPKDGVPRASWQAAWAEAYLSPDGESLLVDRWSDRPQQDTFRCAFFLHYYEPNKPLVTTYGNRTCPPIEAMPARLKRLVPFEPVD